MLTKSCCDNAVVRCFHLNCDSSSPLQPEHGGFVSLFGNEIKTKHDGATLGEDISIYFLNFLACLAENVLCSALRNRLWQQTCDKDIECAKPSAEMIQRSK